MPTVPQWNIDIFNDARFSENNWSSYLRDAGSHAVSHELSSSGGLLEFGVVAEFLDSIHVVGWAGPNPGRVHFDPKCVKDSQRHPFTETHSLLALLKDPAARELVCGSCGHIKPHFECRKNLMAPITFTDVRAVAAAAFSVLEEVCELVAATEKLADENTPLGEIADALQYDRGGHMSPVDILAEFARMGFNLDIGAAEARYFEFRDRFEDERREHIRRRNMRLSPQQLADIVLEKPQDAMNQRFDGSELLRHCTGHSNWFTDWELKALRAGWKNSQTATSAAEREHIIDGLVTSTVDRIVRHDLDLVAFDASMRILGLTYPADGSPVNQIRLVVAGEVRNSITAKFDVADELARQIVFANEKPPVVVYWDTTLTVDELSEHDVPIVKRSDEGNDHRVLVTLTPAALVVKGARVELESMVLCAAPSSGDRDDDVDAAKLAVTLLNGDNRDDFQSVHDAARIVVRGS